MEEIEKAILLYKDCLKDKEIPIYLEQCAVYYVRNMLYLHRYFWKESTLIIICPSKDIKYNIISSTKMDSNILIYNTSNDINEKFIEILKSRLGGCKESYIEQYLSNLSYTKIYGHEFVKYLKLSFLI